MKIGILTTRVLCVAIAFAAAASALAQDGQPAKRKFSSLLNIESLVDNYARFLSRKYDLNESQDSITHELLKAKSREFLGQHEQQLKDLVDRMFDVRGGGAMSQEELLQWGSQVMPLYQEARKIIVAGNDEWRAILTPEQRQIHDQDLKLMNQSFQSTEEQLSRIVAGQMTVDEFRNPQKFARGSGNGASPAAKAPMPPPPPPVEHAPPAGDVAAAPTQGGGQQADAAQGAPVPTPDEGQAVRRKRFTPQPTDQPNMQPTDVGAAPQPEVVESAPPPVMPAQPSPMPRAGRQRTQSVSAPQVSQNFEGEWDIYTRQFIERYKLTPEQTQKANDILKDCKEQGARYMTTMESKVTDLDKRQAGLVNPKDPAAAAKEQTAIAQERQKLLEPIGKIFEKQLKPRLEKLPTRAQRKEAEQGTKPPNPPAGANAAPKPPKPTPTPTVKASPPKPTTPPKAAPNKDGKSGGEGDE